MSIFSSPQTAPEPDGGDPVLERLHAAETIYRAERDAASRTASELERTRAELAAAAAARDRTAAELAVREAELQRTREVATQRIDAAQAEAAAYRERARELAAALTHLHHDLLSSDIPTLVLRACVTLTHATRGMYIAARVGGPAEIRATLEMGGHRGEEPSPYLRGLCDRVMQSGEVYVCDRAEVLPAGTRPAPTEQFRNCLVAPVVLLQNVQGVIIAADKRDGDFDEDDVEALLSVGRQAAVAAENQWLQQELRSAYVQTVSMLADAVEAKDPYTHGHCADASRYASLVADALELSPYDKSVVCYAALLHDVGKIGVSDGVLNKPGPLLPEEVELVRAHVRVGYDLLRHVPALHPVADAVLRHHERWDGAGYPDGLAGEQIPIAARIVAAVDAYCAMITRRSYKEAYPDEAARAELRRCAGTQFDPQVAAALLAVLDSPEASQPESPNAPGCIVLPDWVVRSAAA